MNNYIENIYSYCDRWCEKCAFTSKCRAFVNNENLSPEQLQQNDINNKLFWENTEKYLDKAIAFVNRQSKLKDKDINIFDEIPKQVKFDLFQRKAVSNDVLKAGRRYEDMVDDWLDKETDENRIVAVETQLGGAYKIKPGILQNTDNNLFNQMLSIIVRYQLQLYLKISRAYYSKGISNENNDNSEQASADANGTVKTTLELINRSLSAWYFIYKSYSTDTSDNDIFDIMLLLLRIKNNLVSDFPGAENYKRPGFDYQ